MRRLTPTFSFQAPRWARVKSFLIHSGQSAGLIAAAGLAMAMAPLTPVDPLVQIQGDDAPTAPPVQAEAEVLGPPIQIVRFLKPVDGYDVNSNFGLRHLAGEAKPRPHQGVDIAAPVGVAVLSTAPGEVVRTGYEPGGYGRFAEIKHANGLTSFYAHMSRVEVKRGDRLSGGERLGRIGSTGYSTGPHLHFEIRRGGVKLDPTRFIDREFAFRSTSTSALG